MKTFGNFYKIQKYVRLRCKKTSEIVRNGWEKNTSGLFPESPGNFSDMEEHFFGAQFLVPRGGGGGTPDFKWRG